jgi:hypothetical protein
MDVLPVVRGAFGSGAILLREALTNSLLLPCF